MASKFGTWWQRIRQRPIGTMVIIVVLIALILLIIAVVLFNGTGFNAYTVKSTATETTLSPQTKVTTTVQSQPGKTLWDLLQLLAALAIPIVVGFGVAWFTVQQGKVSERENKDNQRAKALQDYIDKMSELLLEKNLRESSPEDEVRNIARVRTLTVLPGLDRVRKGSVLQFLYESNLINRANLISGDKQILTSLMCNLHHINPSRASFCNECGEPLSGVARVDLRGADLQEAQLREAKLEAAILREAKLRGASLIEADLFGADLFGADLSGANLSRAFLSGADLSDANLSRASLIEADLSDANLSGANLSDAKVANEQLGTAKSLQGATMPDGSKHP